MKTLVLREPGSFHFEDREPPATLAPGEALVRVRRMGVCGTDLHAFKGDQPFFSYPRVLGHELGVEVLAIEGDGGVEVGDYCAVEPYLNCGSCSACTAGRTNCCEKLRVLGVHDDGGLGQHLAIPLGKLHASSSLPLEHLALVEMLTIGAHAVSRACVQDGQRVAVVGAGPIGLSVAQFVQLAGAEPVVIEMDEQRRAFCKQFLNVDHCVDASGDVVGALRAAFNGSLPEAVFDATGNKTSMEKSFGFVGSGGMLVFVGLIQGDISFYNPEFHRKEMTLLSSRNATSADFAYVVRMLEAGKINLTPWITHRVSFSNMIEAFPSWLNRDEGVIKAMIDLDE